MKCPPAWPASQHGLVGPQPGDALSGEGVGQLQVQALRHLRASAGACGKDGPGLDLAEAVGTE